MSQSIVHADATSQALLDTLTRDGHVRLSGRLSPEVMGRLEQAVARLEGAYPYGFQNEGVYASKMPEPRRESPKPKDYAPTIIYPNVGFIEPDLLLPLADPVLQSLIAGVVGDQYYLSNTWMQNVPPGTGRMAYHKDPRGSVTFNIMLDDIYDGMGSTCLVPGSHLNTPPARFCMDDPQKRQPREVDLVGGRGDIVMFTPETWHARAENTSNKFTRRLFYNFYSRSSKPTTSWAKVVKAEDVARATAVLPETCAAMFKLDPQLTATLQSICVDQKFLGHGAASHDNLFADIAHSQATYGKNCVHSVGGGHILPYTTKLMESRIFSLGEYLAQLKLVPTSKILARFILGKRLDDIKKLLSGNGQIASKT